MVALAAYHARTGMAELDQSKQLFDTALAKTEGKNLMVQLNYWHQVRLHEGRRGPLPGHAQQGPRPPPIPTPMQRLTNAIAKRRAKRWLGKHRVKDQCGIDLSAAVPAAAAAPLAAAAAPLAAPPAK